MDIENHARSLLKGDYVEFALFDNHLSIIYNGCYYQYLKIKMALYLL